MKGEPFVNRRYTKGVPFLSQNVHIKDFPRRGGRYAVALSVISETACCLVSKKKKGHCGRKPHRWFTVIYSADKN